MGRWRDLRFKITDRESSNVQTEQLTEAKQYVKEDDQQTQKNSVNKKAINMFKNDGRERVLG